MVSQFWLLHTSECIIRPVNKLELMCSSRGYVQLKTFPTIFFMWIVTYGIWITINFFSISIQVIQTTIAYIKFQVFLVKYIFDINRRCINSICIRGNRPFNVRITIFIHFLLANFSTCWNCINVNFCIISITLIIWNFIYNGSVCSNWHLRVKGNEVRFTVSI